MNLRRPSAPRCSCCGVVSRCRCTPFCAYCSAANLRTCGAGEREGSFYHFSVLWAYCSAASLRTCGKSRRGHCRGLWGAGRRAARPTHHARRPSAPPHLPTLDTHGQAPQAAHQFAPRPQSACLLVKAMQGQVCAVHKATHRESFLPHCTASPPLARIPGHSPPHRSHAGAGLRGTQGAPQSPGLQGAAAGGGGGGRKGGSGPEEVGAPAMGCPPAAERAARSAAPQRPSRRCCSPAKMPANSTAMYPPPRITMLLGTCTQCGGGNTCVQRSPQQADPCTAPQLWRTEMQAAPAPTSCTSSALSEIMHKPGLPTVTAATTDKRTDHARQAAPLDAM